MKKTFISHAHADRRFAGTLARRLLEARIPVWYDEWAIAPGDNIAAKISDGIGESAYFLLVLTPTSTEREWVKREWTAALMTTCEGLNIRIIPILHKGCDIPPLLKPLQYIDFRRRVKKGTEELVSFLRKDMGQPMLPFPSTEQFLHEWTNQYETGLATEQVQAAEILLSLGGKAAYASLFSGLAGKDTDIQLSIMKKMRDYLSKSLRPYLLDLVALHHPHLSPPACGHLLLLGDSTALPELLEFAQNPSREVRRSALRALSQHTNYDEAYLDKVIAVLQESLLDGYDPIRLHAMGIAGALIEHLRQNASHCAAIRHRVYRLMNARNPAVRERAQHLYEQLVSQPAVAGKDAVAPV